MSNEKDLLIAGNAIDLEVLKSVRSTIEVLKEEIDNKAYFAFYTVYSMNDDESISPKVITRDQHVTAVYAHLISEINKLSVFSPALEDEEDVGEE